MVLLVVAALASVLRRARALAQRVVEVVLHEVVVVLLLRVLAVPGLALLVVLLDRDAAVAGGAKSLSREALRQAREGIQEGR